MRPIERFRPLLVALITYAVVATVFVAPVLPDPLHRAIGQSGNDVWNHVWGYAWVMDALLHGQVPVRTTLLGWPWGGSLWFIDAFNVLLTLPIGLTLGPVAAYNAAIWLNFVLCGIGAYVLAFEVTESRPGAWLAGLAFMSTPQLLGQAYNGISETLAAGWMPLALTALLRMGKAPSLRRGAIAGALWGVTVVANWYYGLFTAIFAVVLVAPRIFSHRWRAIVGAAIGGAGAMALIAGPPFWAFSASMSATDALVTRDPDFVWRTLILHNMTDLLALLHPGRFYSPDLKAQFGEDLIVVVYVGHALLWPALAMLWLARPRGSARGWLIAALTFLLFALGPYLFWNGRYVEVLGGWIPTPFLAFFHLFPMFSRISHAYRFVVGLTLALVVLLAGFIKAARQRGWDVRSWVIGLAAARLVETCLFSSAVFPLPISVFDPPAEMRALTDGAVLDLPVGIPVLARSQYLAAQFLHHAPVPYGLNDPTPPVLFYNRYSQYLLSLERTTITILPVEMPLLDLELGRAALVEAGLRWIVVHKALYPTTQLPKTVDFLNLTATLVHDDEALRIYRLDPALEPVVSIAATDAAAD